MTRSIPGPSAAGWQNPSVAEPERTPLVSVVVRTKDRPAFLAEALGSLRAQTFAGFEVVLVDDGTLPPPADVRSPPPGVGLTVVRPEPPGGRTRALNAGVAAARGRWVSYLDDDDLYLPRHLELLVAALERAGAPGAAYTDAVLVRQVRGEDGAYRDGERFPIFGREFDADRLLFSNYVPLVCLMHERSLWEAAGGFDVAFDLYEDWEFLIRLARRTPFVRVPEATALYRIRDDGTNATTAAPWRSAASDAARAAVYRKHRSLQTPETAADLVDGYERELQAAVAREREAFEAFARLREESGAERVRLGGEIDALHARVGELSAEVSALQGLVATERQAAEGREAALSAERDARAAEAAALARHRDEVAAERDAQAARADALQATVDRMTSSLAWRLFTPYWKLQAWRQRR